MRNERIFLQIIAIVFLAVTFVSGCTQMRQAQTAIGTGIDNSHLVKFPWGEVYCGRGTVCVEVEVVRVDFENRESGRVEVTLQNRTADSVAVQIALEILGPNGEKLDSTTFQNVGIPPRQQTTWTMPGIYRRDAKIRVLMRQRTN